MNFHPRRGSDKHSRSELLLGDLIVAFEHLDACNKIPQMYCEAVDILKFPISAPDLVSAKLEASCSLLDTLTSKIDTLQSSVMGTTSTSLQAKCETLDKLVSNLSLRLDSLSKVSPPLVTSVSSSGARGPPSGGLSAVPPTVLTSEAKPAGSPKADRSCNFIIFGLPESSFLTTMGEINKVFHFLVKELVRISKVFRVGKRKLSSEADSTGQGHTQDLLSHPSVRPRPVIVCFESAWDRRMILADSS